MKIIAAVISKVLAKISNSVFFHVDYSQKLSSIKIEHCFVLQTKKVLFSETSCIKSFLSLILLFAFEKNRARSLCMLLANQRNLNYQLKIKSSLYSRCYAKACNEWRGPSPRLSAWATEFLRNIAAVASRW